MTLGTYKCSDVYIHILCIQILSSTCIKEEKFKENEEQEISEACTRRKGGREGGREGLTGLFVCSQS